MKISIKIKFSVFLALLLLLTVSVLSFLVLQGIQQNQKKRYEDILSTQSKTALLYIRQSYLTGSVMSFEEFININGKSLAMDLGSMSGMHVVLYNNNGEVIGNSLQTNSVIDITDTLGFAFSGKTAYQLTEESLHYLSPITVSEAVIGVIQFHYPLKDDFAFYNSIRNLFFQVGLVIFFLSFIAGYFYFNYFAGKILKLKKIADMIKYGQYRGFEPFRSKDELGSLSEGIYFMSNEIERNISTMEEEQRKLKLALEKLQILEKQQKQFISSITHEFKTPLTTVKAYVDLMNMYTDDPQLVEDAKINIGKETQRLYEMVDKALQLSAVEKYDFELHAEKIETKELLLEICSRLKVKIDKYKLKLVLELQNAIILADKESLTHIFINLLDNAIKYNVPDGYIYVRSFKRDGKAYIEIEDTGIGIPNDSREKIFEPFYTVDKSRSREFGGTGLGLALVKQLVEKQNGTIHLTDRKNTGSTFVVSFPLY